MSNEGKVKAPSERLVSAHDFRVGEHTKQIHRKKKRQKRGEGEWGTECESFFVGVLFIPAGFFFGWNESLPSGFILANLGTAPGL